MSWITYAQSYRRGGFGNIQADNEICHQDRIEVQNIEDKDLTDVKFIGSIGFHAIAFVFVCDKRENS